MKQLYTFIFIAYLLAAGLPAYAQPALPDSTTQVSSPYHLKAQFAGSIGFLSAGVGRSFFNEKLETDLFLGYLPKSIGGDRIVTTAIKATYVPIKPIKYKAIDWQPLRTGLQISYTLGDEYFAFEPHDKYPKSYYGFSTALHGNILLGGQVDFARVNRLHKFAAYYEFGSSVEHIVSYVQNPKYLNPGKIFNLALGIRMKL